MKVTRCDRCGADVEPQPQNLTATQKDRFIVFNTDFLADLCRRCMSDLMEWMGKEKPKP